MNETEALLEELDRVGEMILSLPIEKRIFLLSTLSLLVSCHIKPKNHALLIFVENEENCSTVTFNTTPEEAGHMLAQVLPAFIQIDADKGDLH